MKIAIYSGAVPSTTFIERLISGLAQRPQIVLVLTGVKGKAVTYPGNIKVIAYRSGPDFLYLFIKYFLLLCITRPSVLKLCLATEKKGFSNRIKEFVRKASVVNQQPDIFHLQWAKSLDEWMFLQELDVKIILSLRGAHINYSPIVDQKLAESYKKNFPKVDGFHGVCSAIISEAQRYGLKEKKAKVVYSGLNISEFNFLDKGFSHNDPVEFISVGRPHWKKNYRSVLGVLKMLKLEGIRFRYTIVGGISEELLFQVSEMGLTQSIEIIDQLPISKVKEKIQAADFLILSSVEEGIANVVLEAMALGTLVVSSDCGGMPEVVKDGHTGILFLNRSAAGLYNALKTAMALNDNEYRSITSQARQKIESQHSETKMVDDMISLYQNVLGKK